VMRGGMSSDCNTGMERNETRAMRVMETSYDICVDSKIAGAQRLHKTCTSSRLKAIAA